jgi:hypothetical protein
VVAELPRDSKTLATAEMHVNRARGENIKTDKLWREKLLQHISARPLRENPVAFHHALISSAMPPTRVRAFSSRVLLLRFYSATPKVAIGAAA